MASAAGVGRQLLLPRLDKESTQEAFSRLLP